MSPLARFAESNWALVPLWLHDDLERYLVDGKRPPSLFLARVLTNDIVGAMRAACPGGRGGLLGLTRFLQTECPAECHGSRAAYECWIEIGGWRGMRDAEMNYEPQPWRGRLWPAGKGGDND